MGRKPKSLRLSAGELEIMAMLWQAGPLTLAAAHRRFGRYGRPIAYPTMQTRLNRLAVKGVVTRSKDRPASYRAAVSAEQVGATHVAHLAQTVSQDSIAPLVAHLISERPLTLDEIRELRRLLAEAEKRGPRRSTKKRETES